MTILNSGSNKEFAEGWDRAFGKPAAKKAADKKTSPPKKAPAKKSPTKSKK